MFLLSSDTSTDRVVQIITYLGGRYIQTHEYVQMISITISTFAAEATHLLTASPKRTEKFLGAIACGMWILKPTYLDACEKAGKWFLKKPMNGVKWIRRVESMDQSFVVDV